MAATNYVQLFKFKAIKIKQNLTVCSLFILATFQVLISYMQLVVTLLNRVYYRTLPSLQKVLLDSTDDASLQTRSIARFSQQHTSSIDLRHIKSHSTLFIGHVAHYFLKIIIRKIKDKLPRGKLFIQEESAATTVTLPLVIQLPK